MLRLFKIIVLLSNGNWSAPAYGGNYLKTKRNDEGKDVAQVNGLTNI